MFAATPVRLVIFPLAVVLQAAREGGHPLALALVIAPAACIGVAIAARVRPGAVPQVAHCIALRKIILYPGL